MLKNPHFENRSQSVDAKTNIPIFYYQHSKSSENKLDNNSDISYSQFESYQNAFSENNLNFKDFFKWFEREEISEDRLKIINKNFEIQNPKLKIIRNAFSEFNKSMIILNFSSFGSLIEKSQNFDFKYPSKLILGVHKNNIPLTINQLSDGEKMTFLFIADIARRLVIANPSLENPLTGEGIILIDEVEKHLHPKWQKNILNALSTTFPNVQFIVTTHSPIVLTRLKPENSQVFLIKDFDNIKEVDFHYGRDTNSFLNEFMETPYRDKEVQDKIDEMFEYLEDDNKENFLKGKKMYEELFDYLGHNDSYINSAQTLIHLKEAEYD